MFGRTNLADEHKIVSYLSDKMIVTGEKQVRYSAGFNDQRVAKELNYHTRSIGATRRRVYGKLDYELARDGVVVSQSAPVIKEADSSTLEARVANLEKTVISLTAANYVQARQVAELMILEAKRS